MELGSYKGCYIDEYLIVAKGTSFKFKGREIILMEGIRNKEEPLGEIDLCLKYSKTNIFAS